MKTCPHCNHKISDTAKKCKYCWGWATNDYEDLKTRRVDISNKEKNDNVIARTIWIIAGILMIIWWYVSYEHNKIKDWYDTIKYDNWDRYEWEWKNDMKDWFGKWYWADWDRYEWEWKMIIGNENERIIGQIEQNMLENGKMIKKSDTENTIEQIDTNMNDIIKMVVKIEKQ